MMFRDQVGIVAGWFRGWSECEQTVALLALLKRVTRTQARFLQLCLEHSLADCPDIHLLEAEANSAAAISQWPQEPAEAAVALLLAHLPLLQPGNAAAKAEYMKRLQKVLADAIESNRCVEESRQLLSYALIHPATTADDRSALALWLGHLEERLAPPGPPQRRPPAHEWPPEPPEPGGGGGGGSSAAGGGGGAWAEQHPAGTAPRENGHPPFQAPGALPCQLHPSPLKRSLALVPGSPQPPGPGGDWGGPEEPPAAPPAPRGAPPAFGEHAPLSPQSSVASSGSEHTEEPGGRNSFQEDGSGMKDVPSWLKSLRLHKYAALFAQMSYEEMMTLTERHLESQNVTKGARHKIALSIQKLRERQSVLRALEKDILEGGNLWTALQELQQILVTPIKAFRPPPAAPPPPGPAPDGTPAPPDGTPAPPEAFAPPPEAEPPAAAVPDGDIPGQFTRVMGKVCTQLLVSRPDEENITTYLQLLEKCLSHEAFTETQKKRLQSWKQQVLKLLRAFPKKGPLDGPPGYRPPKSWAFGSNSLPIAGSVGGGGGGGGSRPFALPPRALPPPARLGLLGPPGGAPRAPLGAPPAPLGAQGRQSLWFGAGGGPGGSPGSRGAVQRTHSLPVHSSALLAFPQVSPSASQCPQY
ncbi:LOW QUALITY PROTEIN: protein Smaug homolog 2-like [Catharus ustulatus]|uniref:LOW QUALITY PROTEIN: protein Smaug homolog 2-like n=2 Tax=Catharus ustulatus TaxID=91951 RepID=UPI0014090DB9|nr:LOW QUALITY PROTEIN: protein Smaug homolog 2-like [Catharus ustulatus]